MSNKQHNTQYALNRTQDGFTLVELVVAIGIMAMVILLASTVFKTSINSYRIASAQAEIMQKFRAITDQLNNDFRGFRKDAPLFIWFQTGPSRLGSPVRYDQIMFFADGDFQSTQTYNTDANGVLVPRPSGKPVVSNLARIYYGHAQSIDPLDGILKLPDNLRDTDRILSKRQHLSIANQDPPNPQYAQFPVHNSSGVLVVDPCLNDSFEHDTNSLSQWQAGALISANVDNIITGCFGTTASNYNDYRPSIKLADANTLHLLLTEKVSSFAVQWSYFYRDANGIQSVYWWPSRDPDGNGDPADSDFDQMLINSFGFYFNTATPSLAVADWFSPDLAKGVYYPGSPGNLETIKPVFPKALKFTFTLFDSRGVFKDGQTFTHIVYIGD
jgi:prepilin-type N-terminal cleavage/methylation domain-containing protein